MNEKIYALFIPVVINMVKGMKEEINADGLVASADEIISRLEVINESNRITEHND